MKILDYTAQVQGPAWVQGSSPRIYLLIGVRIWAQGLWSEFLSLVIQAIVQIISQQQIQKCLLLQPQKTLTHIRVESGMYSNTTPDRGSKTLPTLYTKPEMLEIILNYPPLMQKTTRVNQNMKSCNQFVLTWILKSNGAIPSFKSSYTRNQFNLTLLLGDYTFWPMQ